MKLLVLEAWQSVCRERPALAQLYALECYHIEPALSFRLGMTLDRSIQKARRSWATPWSSVLVDSELHRAHDSCKLESTEAPDLVVHARGHDDANVLALELNHEVDPDATDLSNLSPLVAERRYACASGARLGSSGKIELVRVEAV